MAHINQRYADWISGKPPDDRTGDEIAEDIMKRAGLKVKTHESI